MSLKVVYSTSSPASPEPASLDTAVPLLAIPGGAAIEVEMTAASAHASNAGLIVLVGQRWLDQSGGCGVSLV